MEASNRRSGDSSSRKGGRGSYGYSYGYGSPYGYGGGSEYGYGYPSLAGAGTTVQKTLQDYILILRERIWYIIASFVLVLGTVGVYTLTQVPIFQSTATVEIFRRAPTVMQVQQVMDSEVRTVEDLTTQVDILKSDTIIDRVAARLTDDERSKFLSPYQKPGTKAPTVTRLLTLNREIIPKHLSLIIDINYEHPNRDIAAKVANYFADEYISYNAHTLVDQSMRAVEELDKRANEQRKKVDDIAASLQAYREKNNSISLDKTKDIVTEKLKELNDNVTKSASVLQESETRWKLVVDTNQKGASLLNLSFIAATPVVSQLQQQVANATIAVAQLTQRYKAKHPQMIQAVDSLNEAQKQLQQAIETAASQIEADYQSALTNYKESQKALASQEADSLKLDRYALEYTNQERDYAVNEQILEHILERTRETSMSSTVENQNARIVDRAAPGRKAVWPDYYLNLGIGIIGGIGLGLSLAFLAAYTDDRVKSAFDVEQVVGLPLLGVVPKVKNLSGGERKVGELLAGREKEVSEAFSTLMSGLQLKPESKAAKCILVTSTIASEGKSFITTNLALTYAMHGERVLIVDCDLRRPAVNRAFGLENLKGVIDVCTSGLSIDEAINKEVAQNLDVLTTGGRSKNPTQILNSKEFALLISELRKRYDRVFIDTPPVAIVSDALMILPLMDGSIYSIFFNKVRRKAAEFCAQRVRETNVPNFGAVLNGLAGGAGGYYYTHYYDKSYKDYYVTNVEKSNGAGAKIEERPQSKRR